MARYDFASDNTAPAAPEAMAALVRANEAGFMPGYGADPLTAAAADAVRALLDVDAEVRFVASGTAANAICLAALARPFEAVIPPRPAHLLTAETGAPGLFGHGVGLTGLEGASGRIDAASLEAALAEPEVSHRQAAAALSLTQATEYGAVYATDALEALCARAKSAGLGVHLDGARLANAAAAGFDVRRIARMGVDLLVLGGAKSGMPPCEAIVILNRDLARRFDARLKQSGQLASKGRFLAAPFLGMLGDGAWLRRAAHANAMAARLAAACPFPLAHPVEANGVFVQMDEARLEALRAEGWFVYRFLDGSVRFMCSWATTAEAVDEIADALRRVA
ncbi:MAG: beta-eliminating lyase-related protein [Phenylobacterium sp.]